MHRVALYVDGFNLYHGLNDLKSPELKWVDLAALAQKLIKPHEELVSVVYFSAYATWLAGPYKRHQAYVTALQTRGVDTVMAHFKKKTVKCFECGSAWTSREEKETDVHLGLRVLADAEDDVFERGILLTADSDLVPVVRTVKDRHPEKTIATAVPPGRYDYGRHLQQVSDQYFSVAKTKVLNSLLPAEVWDADGQLVSIRPPEYAPRDSGQ